MPQVALTCHPSAPSAAVRSIAVDVSGALELRYVLEGDLSRIRISPPGAARRVDELWKRTCFEAFVAARGGQGYREFNFTPSREWAGYDFSGYRAGMTAINKEWEPRISIHRREQRFEIDAKLTAAPPLRLALAAVIEEEDGRLSYWALAHPPGQPDFHHPDSFALEL
jgi:hypothetical protein